MSITIKQPDLENALATIAGVIEKNAIHPVLKYVLIKSYFNVLELSTFSLEIGMATTTECQGSLTGVACVPCLFFLKVVKKISKKSDIILEVKEDVLWITYGKSKLKVQGIDPNEFPELPDHKIRKTFNVLGSQLKSSLEKILPTVVRAKKRFNSELLVKAYIEVNDYAIAFSAWDGNSYVKYSPAYTEQGSTSGGDLSLALSLDIATELKKLASKHPEKVFTLSLPNGNEDHPWISLDNLTIYWKHREDAPKPIFNDLSGAEGKICIDTPKALTKAVGRIRDILGKRNDSVNLRYSSGTQQLFLEQEGKENIQVEVKVELPDDPIGYCIKYDTKEVTAINLTEWLDVRPIGAIVDFACEVKLDTLLSVLKTMSDDSLNIYLAKIDKNLVLIIEDETTVNALGVRAK